MIAEGWKKMLGAAWTSLSQIGQMVWTIIGKIAGGMLELGAAIMRGLIKGILLGAIQLIATVLDISRQIQDSIKRALGISSPSKVFMKIGENVVQGFNAGIENMGGGLGVNIPQVAGGGATGQPSLAVAGGVSGGGSGVYIQNLIMPPGTTREQVDAFNREIAKKAKRRSAKK